MFAELDRQSPVTTSKTAQLTLLSALLPRACTCVDVLDFPGPSLGVARRVTHTVHQLHSADVQDERLAAWSYAVTRRTVEAGGRIYVLLGNELSHVQFAPTHMRETTDYNAGTSCYVIHRDFAALPTWRCSRLRNSRSASSALI